LDWDYALIDAAQTIEDYSDQYGLLQWELDDEDSVVDAVKKIHPFEEARDLATRGDKYKASPGEYFIPKVYRYGGGDLQTFEAWLEKKAAEAEEED
jgi:hypothetical protein